MVFSLQQLRESLPELKEGRNLWVGFSGGLDSSVLLHALTRLGLSDRLRPLHVNHQISPNANLWQAHCENFCASLNLPLVCEKVSVSNSGRGLEDAAREARYQAYLRHLRPGDYLLTAHHRDDQSETFLLRLLRGAGPRGLAAMARERPLGSGRLLRPLLEVSRAELEAYAREQGLSWVEDESNSNTDYDRNYLRQTLMPMLRQRWPALDQRLVTSARLCAESEELLVELAAQDLAAADPRSERLGQSLNLALLMGLSRPRRQNLLRHWLRSLGLDVPEQIHQQQIETQLAGLTPDAEICIDWGKQSLRVYRQRLYAMPQLVKWQELPEQAFALIPGRSFTLALPDGGQLTFIWNQSAETPAQVRLKADLGQLRLAWRLGGERCQPQGRAHSRQLKKLLQEAGLEPWWRERLPLIYQGETLAAVGDLWVCQGYAALEEPGYLLHWQAAEA
jgi:tRNA(Ile)-lysidine synthase